MKKCVGAYAGKTDVCAHWVFCRKFNSPQLLFEAFSHIVHIFGILVSKVNLFSHFRRYYFKHAIFGAPSFTSQGDIHARLLSFFIGNLILYNFYLKHFFIQSIFLSVLFSKVNLRVSSCFSTQYFKHSHFWSPPSFTPEGDRNVCPLSFL